MVKTAIQLAILCAALVACLHFVYDNGLVAKDTITIVVTAVVAALIKKFDKIPSE